MAIINDAHCCFICDQQFLAGEMVLSDVNEGLGHRACFGEDREGYVKDLDTGEPLGPDDPIPAGEPYDPADYPEFAKTAAAPTAWAFERSWHITQRDGKPTEYSNWRPELSWEKPEQTVTVRNVRPLFEGATQ